METLFTITLLELFIGGSGRLLEVGSGTVRMILFAGCLVVSLITALSNRHKNSGIALAFGLVICYLTVHLTALLIGLTKGNDLGTMMVEMQQSLYWLAAPFLALVLSSHDMVTHAAKLIRVSGVVLALGYIGVIVALLLSLIDYRELYIALSSTGEFMFRTETFFFYKGFIYLAISAVFFISTEDKSLLIWGTIVIMALALTLTRGFMLATALSVVLLLFTQRRWRHLCMALIVISTAAIFILIYMPSQENTISDSRDRSDMVRVEDFSYIVSNTSVKTILIGEGLGTLINDRRQVENTFLWAFWRLGIIGVLFWLTPLILCLVYFTRIGRHDTNFRLASAYFFSTILIYIQTLSNPYLNNPIGLSFVIIAIFSLRTMSKNSARNPIRMTDNLKK